MADFSALKTAIQTYIKQNGNEEITGEKLQEILLSVVTTLGDSAINDLVTALADEVAARQNADGTLQQNITNEATARNNADTALGGRIDDEATARENADTALQAAINLINSYIPAQASSSNQLADKDFVNSSIATATATFRGTYNVVTDLELSYNATNAQIQAALATKMAELSIIPDNNDYAFVQRPTSDATPTQIENTSKYKFNGSAWAFEYVLNNSGFTAAQWAAINSGATLELIGKLSALPTNAQLIELLADKVSWTDNGAYDVTANNSGATFASLSALLNSDNLATLIPADIRRGGMSIKFVQSSDNKYIQWRLMADSFSTIEADWQGVDTNLVPGSNNLVDSSTIIEKLSDDFFDVTNEIIINYNIYDFSLQANGSFGTSNSVKHAAVPVNEGEIYYLIGKSASCRAAYATSNSYSSGATIPLVFGTEVISMPYKGQYYKFIIPEGCNYLLFNTGGTFGDTKCFKKYNNLNDAVSSEKKINLGIPLSRVIQYDIYWTDKNNEYSYFINGELLQGKTIRVEVNDESDNYSYIAFLSSVPSEGETVPYCNNTSNSYILKEGVFVVPNDCKYIVIYAGRRDSIKSILLSIVNNNNLYDKEISILDDELNNTIFSLSNYITLYPQKYNIYIDANDIWLDGGDNKFITYVIDADLLKNKLIKLLIPEGLTTRIAFLNQRPSLNNTVSYCAGSSREVIEGEIERLVPSDCTTIYILNGTESTPKNISVGYNKEKTNFNVALKINWENFYKYSSINLLTGEWGEYGQKSYLLPAENFRGTHITLTASENTRLALFNDEPVNGAVVSYCSNSSNELIKGTITKYVPLDCKYIYVYAGVLDGSRDIYINEFQVLFSNFSYANYIQKQFVLTDDSNKKYRLIFDDDFNNGIDKDFWRPVQFNSSSFKSRFYADDKNWYADSGCMILKLDLRDGIYYGPYISTAKTFAISKGKIEARIKLSENSLYLGWCFWTFGQNSYWPKPVEFDIWEKSAGAQYNSNHIHYINDEDVVTDAKIGERIINTNWHTYAIEWDEEYVKFYFDNSMTNSVKVSELNPANSFNYPQQLCFNIKCSDGYQNGNAFLMVDYVKVWADSESTTLQSISYPDMEMNVGDYHYVNPNFAPISAVNKAFSLTSSEPTIVKVDEFEGNHENHYLMRKITALSEGIATLTMTSASGAVVGTFQVVVS